MGAKTIHLAAESRTRNVAASIAGRVKGGERICLYGPLGSGKTTFVRGFLRALGVRGPVRSPTFELIHEYRRIKPRAYHMDFYRLKPCDIENLGLQEYLEDASAVCLIEWPEAAEGRLGPDRLELTLEHELRSRGRLLQARAFGPASSELLRGLR